MTSCSRVWQALSVQKRYQVSSITSDPLSPTIKYTVGYHFARRPARNDVKMDVPTQISSFLHSREQLLLYPLDLRFGVLMSRHLHAIQHFLKLRIVFRVLLGQIKVCELLVTCNQLLLSIYIPASHAD